MTTDKLASRNQRVLGTELEGYFDTRAHKDDIAGPFNFPAPKWETTWADREPARDCLMRCTHCGSVHPRDLLAAVEAGARLRVADMKYGWPHKFYVSGVPNDLAGQQVIVGGISGPTTDRAGRLCRDDLTPEEIAKGHYSRDTYGKAPPDAVVKFYSEHLADADMQTPGGEMTQLARLMAEASGYVFEVREDYRVYYRRVHT